MKGLLKNLGIIIVLIGVAVLVVAAATDNLNNNSILISSVALMIAGFITYIAINKRIID